MTRSRRRSGQVLITVVFCYAVIELGCILLAVVIPDDIYYLPPSREEFATYIELMNSAPREVRQFGWQGPRDELTDGGYRSSPAGVQLGRPCVSLYGDSFTYGAEVSSASAWGNRLAELLECRVDNYGVVGYGTDQSVMRFIGTAGDESPLVVLTHVAENIARNINQNRALIYGSGIALKPRFVFTPTGIRREEVPRLQNTDYGLFRGSMATILRHEYFLPNATELSKKTLHFPYAITFSRIFTYRRIYSGIANIFMPVAPWYSILYESEHPSRALSLTAEMVKLFANTAWNRGKTPVVFILPTAREIVYYRSRGEWIYQPLVSQIEEAGIRVYNLGGPLLARLGDAGIENGDTNGVCDLFCTKPTIQGGHYTERGNALLADVAFTFLSSQLSAKRH